MVNFFAESLWAAKNLTKLKTILYVILGIWNSSRRTLESIIQLETTMSPNYCSICLLTTYFGFIIYEIGEWRLGSRHQCPRRWAASSDFTTFHPLSRHRHGSPTRSLDSTCSLQSFHLPPQQHSDYPATQQLYNLRPIYSPRFTLQDSSRISTRASNPE